MISEDRLMKALTFLADTDEKCAGAKARMKSLEKQEKTIIALCFLEAEGGVAEREHKAKRDARYRDWREKYENAVYEFETIHNKRETETTVIEVWRSLNKERKSGNIV